MIEDFDEYRDGPRLSPSQRRTAWVPAAITAGVLALAWAVAMLP